MNAKQLFFGVQLMFSLYREVVDIEEEEGKENGATKGMVLFLSEHARQRMTMGEVVQADGTFKTISVDFFTQVMVCKYKYCLDCNCFSSTSSLLNPRKATRLLLNIP